MSNEAESMHYDVLIIGAGPAGLSAAIAVKQQLPEASVCILEKAAAVGGHILSGAVLEPHTLSQLLPNWSELDAPIKTKVSTDEFYWLSQTKKIKLPVLPTMCNKGNYIISLGQLCIWLGEQATTLGVDIFPGFAAQTILFNDKNEVVGAHTGTVGLDKHNNKTEHYQPGMNIHAKMTVLAEGARGSCSKFIIQHYNLDKHAQPQTYGLGIKEIWQIPKQYHELGKVIHTIGWPLNNKTYGGSFIYHQANQQLALGLIVGLDYRNPTLSPFSAMQALKQHPILQPILKHGERISYGARALTEGGYQSIPQCHFPGGLLIGCAAGFMNVAKIKGTHTAIQSGMLAAKLIVKSLKTNTQTPLKRFNETLLNSSLGKELKHARNIRPGFHKNLWLGLLNAGIDQFILKGKAPWTLRHQVDYQQCNLIQKTTPIHYTKPNQTTTFSRLASLPLTNVHHNEDQPCHLQLKNPDLAITVNYQEYGSPEQYYCPAHVYEIVFESNKPKLKINASNCIHCKCCDIKDPRQNINWVPPEGGGGPNYQDM